MKNLLLEKKLGTLGETLEKKEAQLNEVLTASNLDPTALSVVTRKLEVSKYLLLHLFFFTLF
jgi:growth arrest-specific protein 8